MSVNLDDDMRMAAELSQLRQDVAGLRLALRSKDEANAGLRLENAELRAKLCKVAMAVENTVREYLK